MPSELKTTILRALRGGLAWTECQGFHWVQANLTAPLRSAAAKKLPSELRAEAHCLLGDIAFCCCAHKLAREHYRRTLAFGKKPVDAAENLAFLAETTNSAGFFSAIPVAIGRGFDCLARGQAEAARQAVRGKRSVDALRIRAMASGIENDAEGAFVHWQRISRRPGQFTFSTNDWYYSPPALRDDRRFWQILKEIAPRVFNLGLHRPTRNGLSDWWAPPSLCAGPTSHQQMKLMQQLAIGFHLARSSGNSRQLERFLERYPDWEDVRLLLHFHAEHRRYPTWTELIEGVSGDASEFAKKVEHA